MREGAPPSQALERLTRAVIRFRWLVVASWIVLFLVGGMLSGRLGELFESQATVPGTDAQRVNDILEEEYGHKSYAGWTLVVRADDGDSADQLIGVVEERAASAAKVVETGELLGVQKVSETTLVASIGSTLDIHDAHGRTDEMRAAIGSFPGAESWLTGNAAIAADTMPVFERDLKVGELYIAIPIALLILAFVFGTLALLVPLIFAIAAIPTTLGLVWVFAHYLPMEQPVQNLVTFIGLGIAIDYSLLVVYRYREELKSGASREDAVARTIQTAGRAVIFSGTAVAIGLALMLAMPVPGLQGYGLAGLLIPIVSILCALTLLPVLLYSVEGRLDRVRLVPRRVLERRESQRDEENFWLRWAHRIMRRPVLFAAASLAALLLLAGPVFSLELGPGTQEVLPAELESTQGLRVLSAEVGAGALDPVEILVDTSGTGLAGRQSVELAVANFVTRLNADPAVGFVGVPTPDAAGRYLRLQVISKYDFGAPESKRLVERLRGETVVLDWPAGTTVLVGGTAAWGVDFIDRTYGAFPWLVLVVLALTYLLLVRAFRSVLLPLKAIVLNVLSVGAAYGVLVVTFRYGWGEPFGLIPYDQITAWIPVFLFAVLFGLSMDYEVFLVSRMREEWDATKDNAQAVAVGLAKTGRLVTAAGLIMVAAFMGLVAGSFVELQQFGFGLAVAILIDVTIVRALLLPSAMTLFGRWNWWLPDTVARLLRVEPSPLEPASPEPGRAVPV